jgi:hypothetical protein
MEPWMSSREVAEAAGYGTTLKQMTPAYFDLLERHGYETAKWNLMPEGNDVEPRLSSHRTPPWSKGDSNCWSHPNALHSKRMPPLSLA